MSNTQQPCSIPAAAGKPALGHRPLIGPDHAVKLGRLFKVLANDTRLRLLHALVRDGELSVTDLAEQLDMAPQAISNQLQRLADREIVTGTRDGVHVRYSITDPCVPGLLDLGFCLMEETRTRRSRVRHTPARAR